MINNINITGTIVEEPHYLYSFNSEKFYSFTLSSVRMSGTVDLLNVIASEYILQNEYSLGQAATIQGQIRSKSVIRNNGSKGTDIYIFADSINHAVVDDENTCHISGTICKNNRLRYTPNLVPICDFIIAVSRNNGRSDYIPCIAWNRMAHMISEKSIGEYLSIEGRLQSRYYTKIMNNNSITKTAYEVSIYNIYESKIK